jgi:hypothetical protein
MIMLDIDDDQYAENKKCPLINSVCRKEGCTFWYNATSPGFCMIIQIAYGINGFSG